jgi:hypothetical protein
MSQLQLHSLQLRRVGLVHACNSQLLFTCITSLAGAMFSGELKAAANKLQREQAERAERERQRIAKERLLAERQRQRQAQRQEDARERRLQAAAAAAAVSHNFHNVEACKIWLQVVQHAQERWAAAPASAPATAAVARAPTNHHHQQQQQHA